MSWRSHWGARVGICRSVWLIDDISGGVVKERFQCGHESEPGVELEALVRFVEAEPPTALRVVSRSAEELAEEGGELLDGAGKGFGKQRAKEWILCDAGIEMGRDLAAGFAPAEFVVHAFTGSVPNSSGRRAFTL